MNGRIGRYTVISPNLGAGGQAHLFEVEADGQLYAMKLLIADANDAEAHARFDLEAEILKTIDHPNIVRYIDDGVDGQYRYIVMPRLPGQNLRFALSGGRQIDPRRAGQIGLQVAKALQVFHQLGAVHRDVKPENVQLDDTSDHVWLLDAGYARYVKRTRITGSGARPPGTEGYRAPETLHGSDYKQSDFFSLGILLYEMIAGRHPFNQEDPLPSKPIVALRRLVPHCPPFLANAVDRLLAWEVKNRPQTAAEVIAALGDPAHGIHLAARDHLEWAQQDPPPLVFRLTRSNASSVREAAEAGVRPDAYLAPATGAAAQVAADIAAAAKRDLMIDPELQNAAYTGFEGVPGFASTLCAENGAQPLALDDLDDSRTLQEISRLALDVETGNGATVKLVPGFILTDTAANGWLGCNSVMLDTCAETLPSREPFAVRVLASLEAAPTAIARQRLAETLGRHNPELFLLSFDGLGANATAEQLLRALEISAALQEIAPCTIVDAGAFGPLWLAFNLGVAVDLVAESPLSTRPYCWASQRFDFPSLLTSLRLEDAERMLAAPQIPEVRCPCFVCRDATSTAKRLERAPAHNAAMASRERATVTTLTPTVRKAALRYGDIVALDAA